MMLNGIKILIGDDSILARKQLKDIVSTYGTPVFLEASNGQDAIDLYKKESPELVFLDIVMPVNDGISPLPRSRHMIRMLILLSFHPSVLRHS